MSDRLQQLVHRSRGTIENVYEIVAEVMGTKDFCVYEDRDLHTLRVVVPHETSDAEIAELEWALHESMPASLWWSVERRLPARQHTGEFGLTGLPWPWRACHGGRVLAANGATVNTFSDRRAAQAAIREVEATLRSLADAKTQAAVNSRVDVHLEMEAAPIMAEAKDGAVVWRPHEKLSVAEQLGIEDAEELQRRWVARWEETKAYRRLLAQGLDEMTWATEAQIVPQASSAWLRHGARIGRIATRHGSRGKMMYCVEDVRRELRVQSDEAYRHRAASYFPRRETSLDYNLSVLGVLDDIMNDKPDVEFKPISLEGKITAERWRR